MKFGSVAEGERAVLVQALGAAANGVADEEREWPERDELAQYHEQAIGQREVLQDSVTCQDLLAPGAGDDGARRR